MGSCLKILRGVPIDPSYQHVIAPHKDYSTKDPDTSITDYRSAVLAYLKSKTAFTTNDTSAPEITLNQKFISYIRETDKTVKVNVKRDALEGCNYLMYTNDINGDGYAGGDDTLFWHFAFITKLEYISEGATRIHFEEDVMTTWLPFIQVRSAQVEREHVYDDSEGANIVPEPISPVEMQIAKNDSGEELLNDAWASTTGYEDFVIILAYSASASWFGYVRSFISLRTVYTAGYNWMIKDMEDNRYAGSMTWQNGAQPCYLIAYKMRKDKIKAGDLSGTESDLEWFTTLCEAITDKLKGKILTAYAIPAKFMTDDLFRDDTYDTTTVTTPATFSARGFGYIKSQYYERVISLSTADCSNYKGIKNNKLKTFPFSKIKLRNSSNNEVDLRPEFFPSLTDGGRLATFSATFSVTDAPYILIKPDKGSYKIDTPLSNAIVYNAFPTIPWSETAISQYERDNAIKGVTSALSSLLSIWTGFNAPGFGYQLGGYSSLLRQGGDILTAARQPAQACGSAGAYMDLVSGTTGIILYLQVPTDKEMKRIDDFFSKYGYAVNQVKTPNVFKPYWAKGKHVRKAYNYVKCVNAQVSPVPILDVGNNKHVLSPNETMFTTDGNIKFANYMPSSEELDKINLILANGVTFWENPDEIGNYEQDNSPMEVV